jgi:hypothetical protein
MARNLWIVSGRKADGRVLAASVSLAWSLKLQRLAEIRVQVERERGAEADDRALAKETRKRWRQEDIARRKLEAELRKVGGASRKAARELAKPIYVYAQPNGGGQISEREIKRFDAMFHHGRSFERKRDGLFSFHCKFTSRGFGDRRKDRSRTYKPGEAVKHARYIMRELAREIARGGLISNIAQDPDEIAGFFAALEELETHDRDNANVYMSLVISLPHELTPESRERVLGEICELLAEQGLPYVGVLHAPDPRGDQRNFHTHIMFSLRPCEIEAPGRYVFCPDKYSDINDEAFIYPFRLKVAAIFNAAMERENHSRRFTGLSDADRGLEPRAKGTGKSTPGQKHRERKQQDLALMQRERALVFRRGAAIQRLSAKLAAIIAEPVRDRRQEIATRRAAALVALQQTKSHSAQSASDRARRLQELAAATLESGRRSVAALGERLTAAAPAQKPITPIGMAAPKSVAAGPSALVPQAGQPVVLTPAPNRVARAQPADRQRDARGTDRRRAIAAAAWQLRQSSYPPQVKTASGFALAPSAPAVLGDAARFEAEEVIQAAHVRKRQQMLTAVRRAVEGMERSPFIEANGRARLPSDILDQPLRTAVRLAYRDPDYLALVSELHALWLEREKAARAAEVRKAREAAERRARMQPGIQKVLDAIEPQVRIGRWPADKVASIRDHVSTMAGAISDGRLVMRSTPSGEHFWFASEGLPIIAAMLADTAPGRAILVDLGKLTLKEPLDYTRLRCAWTAPPAQQERRAGQTERDGDGVQPQGKDGAER